MRLLVVGASSEEICGVRACAQTLEPALARAGAELETVWWERSSGETAHEFAERAAAAARAHQADATLWHYSVFSYGRRGIPFDVPMLARALARPAPLVGFLHELAVDWRGRGGRGVVQAAMQRLALRRLVGTLAGAIVTTDGRAAAVGTSVRVLSVPVPSNIPPVAERRHDTDGLRIGVFGFRTDRIAAETVTGGVAALAGARLVLVGAPGPDSPEAERWRRAATAAGCALEFTGLLEPRALSEALAGLDAVILPDPGGPTARRGTLAAALAHGIPVIAFDGPKRWDLLADAGAALLVPVEPTALANGLRGLAADPAARRARGEAGRAFYARTMAPDVVAAQILPFVERARESR